MDHRGEAATTVSPAPERGFPWPQPARTDCALPPPAGGPYAATLQRLVALLPAPRCIATSQVTWPQAESARERRGSRIAAWRVLRPASVAAAHANLQKL